MKKIYALMVMLLCLAMSAGAASKLKLYVNPGHGGYTSNDRQTTMPIVNDVKLPEGENGYNKSNCFWESSGNTYRAWGIQYFWNKRVVPAGGTACKLSRSTNTQDGDLTLTAIAAASSSYGGYFMSLHTNAGNNSANYMIVMCRSVSSSDYSAYSSTSLEMCKKSAYYQGGEGQGLHLTNKTYTTDRGMTDRNFYNGTSLGVLRTNTAPGYLAESWFHDYRPEAFRLCSVGYNYFLAWQMMRAYLDSPGLDVDIYPIIFGDIRDVSKPCGYTGYATRGRDQYLALNGCTVTLVNNATGGTKTYTVDQFNNGFYCFYDCVHGATYTITVEKEGYKTKSQTVTVGNDSRGTQHKLCFDMEEGTNSGITVSPSTISFDQLTVGSTSSKSVTVTGEGLSSAISITSSNTTDFTLSASSVAAAGGTFTVTYKPSAAGNHSTTLTFKSGSYSRTMVVSGSAKNPPLTFTEVWNHSETSGKSETWSATKSKIRNFTYGNGKLYVVNAEDSKIYVVNARTGKLIKELDMTGVTGGTLPIMDVKYVSGKIVATGLASTAETGDATLKVYVWDNDDAAPRTILNTTNIGGFARIGDTFSIKGNLTTGGIYYTACANADAAADDAYSYIVCYPISGGTVSTTPTSFALSNGDEQFAVGLSPRIIAEEGGNFWVIGQSYYPTVVDPEGVLMYTVSSAALGGEVAGNAFAQFVFKGTQYAFATTYTPSTVTTERLKGGRAVLMDCTGGWDTAENIGEYPSAGLGSTRNTSMSGNIEVAVNGDEGVEMWVLVHNQGIAYYLHGTAASDDDSSDDGNDDNTGDDDTIDEPVTVGTLTCNPGSITLSGVYGSTDNIYTDVVVTDTDASTELKVASGTSAISVTKLDGWNDYTGGTIRLTLNTSFTLGVGTHTSYIAVVGGSNRVEVQTTVILKESGESAIESVKADDASVEYYNLQGVRVPAENLTRGIYIKRQGKKTSKILVK